MNINDYIIMLAFTFGASYGLMHMVRWLRNWKATGAYRMGSDNPPWGWPVTLIIGAALVALFLIGPTMAARWLL